MKKKKYKKADKQSVILQDGQQKTENQHMADTHSTVLRTEVISGASMERKVRFGLRKLEMA